MNDIVFWAIEARIFIEMNKPNEVLQYLKEKSPKLPLKYIAEMFIEAGDKEHAIEAITKMKDAEEKVSLLISI